jgi:hypothetical protein
MLNALGFFHIFYSGSPDPEVSGRGARHLRKEAASLLLQLFLFLFNCPQLGPMFLVF